MANTQQINELIQRLMAIACFSKDIHYNAIGIESYSDHLLADRLCDGLDEFIDTIKENILLGNKQKVLKSTEYMNGTIKIVPDVVSDDNTENFRKILKLIDGTISFANKLTLDKGDSSLVDNICEKLKNDKGLLQIRTTINDRTDK